MFTSRKIVVIGDLMLDGYASGAVERISPEAPVPVLRHLDHREVPGGAANVAMNIVALGGCCTLIGCVGEDYEAKRLAALLEKGGVQTCFISTPDRPTISKLRVLAGNHQLLRIDRENETALPDAAIDELLRVAGEALLDADALILSDYNKGTLSDLLLAQLIKLANERSVKIFVDPKRKDFSVYAGATYITPNRSELSMGTGLDCYRSELHEEAAKQVIAQTGAGILLTLSESGMVFFDGDGTQLSLPTEAQEVFDVSGAGDTVIATFALAVADGLSKDQALKISNCAAGIAVGKAGTVAVTQAEIMDRLSWTHDRGAEVKIASWPEALKICDVWKSRNLSVGFTNGCFDLLHVGHVRLLRECAQNCDRLVVALNTDASVKRLKGESRPIQSELARGEVMAAIAGVDLVVLFDQDTPYELIQLLMPDLLVKGGDYELEDIVGASEVMENGGQVLRVSIVDGYSTTRLSEKIKNSA